MKVHWGHGIKVGYKGVLEIHESIGRYIGVQGVMGVEGDSQKHVENGSTWG